MKYEYGIHVRLVPYNSSLNEQQAPSFYVSLELVTFGFHAGAYKVGPILMFSTIVTTLFSFCCCYMYLPVSCTSSTKEADNQVVCMFPKLCELNQTRSHIILYCGTGIWNAFSQSQPPYP
jgi:hypothetical protein